MCNLIIQSNFQIQERFDNFTKEFEGIGHSVVDSPSVRSSSDPDMYFFPPTIM